MNTDSLTGYLLTRHQRDAGGSIELSYWLATDQAARRVVIPKQEAVCFVPVAQQMQVRELLAGMTGIRLAEVELCDLERQPVLALYSRTLSRYYDVIERLNRAGVPLMEEDIRPVDRYLMERFIHGAVVFEQQGAKARLRPAQYAPQLHLLSIDLETTMRADRILSIGLYGDGFERVLMLGSPEAVSSAWLEYYADEGQLLRRFMQLVQEYDPDAFIGWNVIGFDFRVLESRAQALGVPLRLGRDQSPLRLHQAADGRVFARLSGRVVLDGIDTLKGASWHFERYSLNYVAAHMLGREKLIDSPDDRGEEIQRLFREDKPALAAYNLEDCRLVWDIFVKADLLAYLQARTALTGLPIDKVGGSAAAFDYEYLPRLHRAGYVAPPYASGVSGLDVPGGFVMDSKPGLFSNVLVLDFKSLYPSIIRTFQVDPAGLAEGLRPDACEAELVPGFHHAIFSRRHAILPELINTLGQAREQAKRENNQPLSHTIKIIMNSFYGVLGSNVCRFYDQRLSGSITLRGHEILNTTRAWIEAEYGFEVIYGDTDSVFVWLGDDFPAGQTQVMGERLARELNTRWQVDIRQRFDLPCYLELEYETCYQRFLMPRMRHSELGSKKRYAGLKTKAGGEQVMVFRGLENVRSDWSPLAREFQQHLYERIFTGQAYAGFVRELAESLFSGQRDGQLVCRKRLRKPLNEYLRNRPLHVQAALKAAEQGGRFRVGDFIEYVMTQEGPQCVGYMSAAPDYHYYSERQLGPVADSILQFLGQSYDQLVAPQIGLF